MLVTALFSMLLTIMYFRDVEDHPLREGIRLGVLWLLASIILDQGPFVWGLMRLSFPEYLRDAGVGYLLYPIVTLGAGFLLSADRNAVEDSEASGHLTTPYAPFLSGPGKTPSPKKTGPGART
jgi:hypothetical protein